MHSLEAGGSSEQLQMLGQDRATNADEHDTARQFCAPSYDVTNDTAK
jgi:hypothetical protein